MVLKTASLLMMLLVCSFSVNAEEPTNETHNMADEPSDTQDSKDRHPLEGNFDITFAGWSEHLTSTGRNQDNYIFGFRYKNFEAFTLHNSFETRSYILAYHAQMDWKSWVKVGIRVGGITGYTKEENAIQVGGVTPLFAPTLTLHYQKLGFETAIFTDVVIFSLKLMF